MKHVAILICIRSLYPHFLFKRGSIVEIIFMLCLLALMGSSLVGCVVLARWPLEYFEVPFAPILSCGLGVVWLWLLIVGIARGVTYG